MSTLPADTVAVPASALRELAKWAFAASYFDSMVSLEKLRSLPVAGDFVEQIAAANERREASVAYEEFDAL